MMTTADKICHVHLNSLKVAWQKDHDDLLIHKSAVNQLRAELSNLCSLTDLQTIRGDLGILYSSNTENPHSFVDAIERSLPREYMESVKLKCCVRSGDSWIILASEQPIQRLKDSAFDNAVSSMASSNIYHLKQLMPSSKDTNILGRDSIGVCVLPVFPMVCFWLLESEIVENTRLTPSNSRKFVPLIPNSSNGQNQNQNQNQNQRHSRQYCEGNRNEERDSVENECERAYRAAIFLTGGFYPVLEAASQYCMSSLVHYLEGQQLNETVSFFFLFFSLSLLYSCSSSIAPFIPTTKSN